MNEVLNPSGYDAHLEVFQGRKVFTHRSLGSLASAMDLGSNHSVFRFRSSFGDPYTYSFIDPQGNIHRSPRVYAPTDQQTVRQARERNGIGEVEGRVRVQNPTGDALLAHAPDPYRVTNRDLADCHVRAWRQDVQQSFNINPVGGVIFYMHRRGVTAVDYRINDVHVITAFPEWSGHTIQSVTEGISSAIPQVEVEQMAL